MNLTSLFVRRPTLAFALLAAIALAGYLAATTLVRQLNPNVPNPSVTISVTYGGASTTVMRDSIVAPIEDQIAGTSNLATVASTIESGAASISASYATSSDPNTDLVNVQKAVQAASQYLPRDLTAPVVSISDPSEQTVSTFSLTSTTLAPARLSAIAQSQVVPAFQALANVSNVYVNGAVIPAFEVSVDPRKLAAYGLTLGDVVSTIGASNVRAPGGTAYEANRQTQIDVRGDITTPANVLQLPLRAPQALPSSALDAWTAAAGTVRIGDVARVTAAAEPRTSFASLNGIGGVAINVQKTSSSSEIDAANGVNAALPAIAKRFPDITFGLIENTALVTQANLDSVFRTLLEGIAFTGVVMLFFLGSWRNAAVVLVSIPASLAVTLFVMKLAHLTIDTVSLLGMTLVIGILVDDSTVVLENVERHFARGASARDAAIAGRSEIGIAAIVITLVDVVVFLPIAFIAGQVGRNLLEFGVVIVIATLTSLAVSFTITPALAGNWSLHARPLAWAPIVAFERGFDAVRRGFVRRALPWALRHGGVVVAASLVATVAAVSLVPLGIVGEEYIPPVDRGEVFVQVVYPVGTPLATTTAGVLALEDKLLKLRDVRVDLTTAGTFSAPFGGQVTQSNVGQVHVWLRPDRATPTVAWVGTIGRIARETLPGALAIVVPETGHGTGQPIDEIVSDRGGGDPTAAARAVYALMQRTPGAANVITSAAALAPQMSMVFDRAKARALDVSIATAATAARAAFGGALATQFETRDGIEQVQVIYPLADRRALAELASVQVRSGDGALVHLGDFTTLTYAPAPPLITRVDRASIVHVSANVAPGASLSGVQAAFDRGLAGLHLPNTIAVRPVPLGQQDLMRQTLAGLGGSLVVSIALVFVLMVALYDSYRSPLVVMFSVPVAAVGALGALALARETLNLYSLIGTILLVGLAAKNGILLVDYANTLRARGRGKLRAIVESVETRFRPIAMTSLSVVVGNVPLALALEPGSQVRASLGTVVIGGIVSSLALTLVVVPIAYLALAPAARAATSGERARASETSRPARA